MGRIVFVGLAAVAAVFGTSGTALADANTENVYDVSCPGGLHFVVVSPDHAAAGQDLGSTHVLVAPPGSLPEAQVMTCTVSAGGDTFAFTFLVKPATH